MKIRLIGSFPWLPLIVLIVVTALMATASPTLHTQVVQPGGFTDVKLYRRITERVRAGEDYYAVAAAEQRAHGFPTRPAITIREPTEAWLLAMISGEPLRRGLLWAVGVLSVLAVHFALRQDGVPAAVRVSGTLLSTSSLIFLASPGAPYIHEIWAGFLVTASVGAWRAGHCATSVALAVAACLFREIAAPIFLVMGAWALAERRWREVWTWTGATAAYGFFAILHLWLASRQVLPTDTGSQGWVTFGGWSFIMATATRNVGLFILPTSLASFLVAASLVGFGAAAGVWERRLASVVLAFAALFCVAGRPENAYWGFLYTPLVPLGLVYVPRSILALGRAVVLA